MESKAPDAKADHHFQGKLIVTCSHYGLQFVVSLIIGIILVTTIRPGDGSEGNDTVKKKERNNKRLRRKINWIRIRMGIG